MGAINKILGTVGGVLGMAVLAGGVAMAVPESRNWILDEVAKSSNAYKTQVEENDKLRLEISELKTDIAKKQSEVTTLTEQKVVLLNTVTKIDNEINSTTDTTTLDNLQERKTAILEQVDDLNGQIASKQAEINRLQARVEELESQQSEYEVVAGEPFKVFNYNYLVDGETRSFGFSDRDTDKQTMNGSYTKEVLSDITTINDFRILNYLYIYDNAGTLITDTIVEDNCYLQAETCNIATKIYDATGRLVNISELDDLTEYHIMSSFDYTLNDSEQITDFTMTLSLDETVTPAYLNYAQVLNGTGQTTGDNYTLYINSTFITPVANKEFDYALVNSSNSAVEVGKMSYVTNKSNGVTNCSQLKFISFDGLESNISFYGTDMEGEFSSASDAGNIRFSINRDNLYDALKGTYYGYDDLVNTNSTYALVLGNDSTTRLTLDTQTYESHWSLFGSDSIGLGLVEDLKNTAYSYANAIFVLTDDCSAVTQIRLLDAEGNTVHIFLKQPDVADEPVTEEQTVTADNLAMSIAGGPCGSENYVIISYNDNGSSDKYIQFGLDAEPITIEFISYDSTANTMTFKRTDTNETFDLTDIEMSYHEDIGHYVVDIAYYNGGELAC